MMVKAADIRLVCIDFARKYSHQLDAYIFKMRFVDYHL